MHWLSLPFAAVLVIIFVKVGTFVRENQCCKKLKKLAARESKEAIDWFHKHY
jgi:hypothetical protein